MPKKTPSSAWTLRDGKTLALDPHGVMGIVNLTPDSFYDGDCHNTPDAGLKHARTLWNEGAHILDIGAESTRPGAEAIDADTELGRLLPVLRPLMDDIHAAHKHVEAEQTIEKIPPYVSVDTYHAKTAKTALELGVHIINDVSACSHDLELLEIIAHYKPGYVLMHSMRNPQVMQENITHDNIVDNIRLFFEFHLQRLTAAGLPESNIVIDLGIGFGKSYEQNMILLQNINRFKQMGLPMLIAISMKSFLPKLLQCTDTDFDIRAKATQTVTCLLAKQGFYLHRVHHVADTLRTLHIAENL